jgi:hypothetical protein
MKAKTFENLIRKVVREEIDYALRREIKTLKEDLRDELKPTIVEHTEKLVEVPNNTQQPMSETTKSNLRAKIMGSNPLPKKQFVGNSTLNDLLNETAQGDTNLNSSLAPMSDPFTSSEVMSTEAMPESVANVVNRDYSALMKAIDKKKNK